MHIYNFVNERHQSAAFKMIQETNYRTNSFLFPKQLAVRVVKCNKLQLKRIRHDEEKNGLYNVKLSLPFLLRTAHLVEGLLLWFCVKT